MKQGKGRFIRKICEEEKTAETEREKDRSFFFGSARFSPLAARLVAWIRPSGFVSFNVGRLGRGSIPR
jgi:hypothetical protein